MSSLAPELLHSPTRAKSVLRIAAACITVAGVLVIVGWHAHWTALLQGAPGAASMKYNTALCFILCGLAGGLLTGRHSRWAVIPGALAGAIGVATLLEYLYGARWPLDEVFVKDYLVDGSIVSGRMSPLTATCFTLMAVGLVGAGTRRASGGLQLLALLSASVVLVTGAAAVGYLLDVDAAFGWGIYAGMAAQTSVAFLVLALALIGWSWSVGRSRGVDFVRWLPATASVTVMGMVTLGSSISQTQLQSAVNLDKHTYEVLLTAHSLFGQLQDEQRGMRRFAVLDQADALDTFRSGAAQAPQTLAELEALTSDNPEQKQHIANLRRDMNELLGYAQRLVAVHDSAGRDAAARLDDAGEGRALMDRARIDIQRFSEVERVLLTQRNGVAERNFRSTGRLTIAASLVATFILAFALFLSDRELMRRRRADALLADSLKLQSEILTGAQYAIISSRPDGTITSFNPAAERMLGYSAADVIGRATPALWHDPGELAARIKEIGAKRGRALRVPAGSFISTARPGKADEGEWTFIRRDGSRFRGSLVVTALTGPDGAVSGYLGMMADVTERHQMERLKDEFISTVSHELRTPLTSIRGSLGLLAGGVLGPLPDKAGSMVKIAHQNSERLVRIINDILDIEKIEAGKLELQPARLLLRDLLEQALEVNQGYADKYQVRLVLEPVAAGAAVLADPGRVMQVMANLLSNAAKFSQPDSTINIRASDQGARMRIEVEDHGAGIPEEFRPRVFDKFAQADGSSSRRFEGTGLGLSITRQLVEAMGGSIGFQSVVGQGTTFYIELPRAPDVSRELSDTSRWRVLICQEPTGSAKPRVLHVEDDLDLCRVLRTALEDQVDIVTAMTLEEALSRLQSEVFSLVLLDVKLPDGDGLTLLERLPPAGQTTTTPVVILSATEVAQEVQRRVAAALVKSRVSESAIVRTILSLVRADPQPVSSSRVPSGLNTTLS